jgi:hypothetical protein
MLGVFLEVFFLSIVVVGSSVMTTSLPYLEMVVNTLSPLFLQSTSSAADDNSVSRTGIICGQQGI